MNDTSFWEAQAVSDILGAALPELNLPGAVFQVETLNNQVDFEKDQLNVAVPHLLIAYVGADHEHGFIGADPFTLAFCAVVPGGSQYERRSIAANALKAVANWMRTGTPYQPNRSFVEKVHPLAIATLTATRVG
jgi:hypothetical protein